MESETANTPAVNADAAENGIIFPDKFPREIPEELGGLVRRIDAYAAGCLRNGKPYETMKAVRIKFAKRTRYSWDHVDRVTRVWMRWTTRFKFSRVRWGRSTVIQFSYQCPKLVLSLEEVRRRLVGAIKNYVGKSGSVYVDRRFLENFHGRYPLPPEQILRAWTTIYRIEGCVCQWQQRGRRKWLRVQLIPAAARASHARQLGGRAKFSKTLPPAELDRARNSLRQNASGISPPTGGKIRKQGLRPESQTDPAALARPGLGGAMDRPAGTPWGDSIDGSAADWAKNAPRDPKRADSGENPETSAARPPHFGEPPSGGSADPPPKTAVEPPTKFRWQSAQKPLQMCDHWVSGGRLAAKANFLAFQCFAPLHAENWRVKFGAMHARNFADAALRAGFVDEKICAAYRTGMVTAHAAAERDYHADISADGWREPSQVIAVAWRELRRDERTDAQRWAEIFAGRAFPTLRAATRASSGAGALPRKDPAAPPPRGSSSSTATPKPARQASPREGIRWRTIGPGLRIRETDMRPEPHTRPPRDPADVAKRAAAKLPDVTPALAKLSLDSPATLESYLAAKKLTVADLLKLSRAEQQELVRAALAAQRKPAP